MVYSLPMFSHLARKSGHALACPPDAERLLAAGELVGVCPEGYKGLGKPFSQRYQLQRFGRGGFAASAIRAGVPIVPCAIVGAEEIFPMIANARPLARLFGFPYFPITPLFPWFGALGAVPLPSRWFIGFGNPMATEGYGAAAADDPATVFELTDQVRETIQQMLYDLLLERGEAFG
jgi:1-acyl-sn-glycerol-3-phosphate acyltransferase